MDRGEEEWGSTGSRDGSPDTSGDFDHDILGSGGAFSSIDIGSLIVQSMKDGFSLLDLRGNHVYVNPAFCAITGFSEGELIGTGVPHPYWPPEEYERIHAAMEATLSGGPRDFELVFMRKNGERFPVTVSPFPLKDVEGRVVGYSATIKDITGRVQAENELRDAHQRMRLHVEKTPIAVIEWDTRFRVTQWNPAAEKIFGYTHGEAMGRHASFIIPEQARHLVDLVWHDLMQKSGGERATNQNVRKDGTMILCEWYNTPLVDDRGVVTGAASLAMDVTERIRAEEAQREVNRELEVRVAQRTKELEGAFGELVRRNSQLRMLAIRLADAENNERRRIARLLHDNYQQLLVAAKMKTEIIQGQVKDEAGLTTGRQILQILGQAIEASRSLAMDLAPPMLTDTGLDASMEWIARWMVEHQGLSVRVVAPDPFPAFPADITLLLFHAVRELLLNVSKHAGVKTATVTLIPEAEGVRVVVADLGQGFEPGRVLDQPKSFGLFHLRERLAIIDGRLDIQSAPGQGTTISMYVPVSESIVEELAPVEVGGDETSRSPVVPSAGGRKIRVLIADDHAVVRQGLVQVLSREKDLEIVGEAVNGQDALDKIQQLQPNVVLMDVTMPRLNGLEATRLVAARYPDVRVIGLSMHEQDDMRERMLAAGAVDYLSKNRPIEDLVAAIRDAMARRQGATR